MARRKLNPIYAQSTCGQDPAHPRSSAYWTQPQSTPNLHFPYKKLKIIIIIVFF